MADGRLEEAAYAGDVALFRRLLEEDRLLLQRQAAVAASSISDAPLHIAASLGHLGFVREILAINPHLARCRNGDGLSALHLASANGHLDVVKELLSPAAAATELCLLLDNNGFMPVHTAAAQGRVEVLRELLDAPLEYPKTRALTSHGESILHLSVKSNSYETLQYLLERDDADDELLNLKDEKGNTVLHLAVARRQFQIVKLLLGRQGIQVNAMNSRNCTALDVLLDPPSRPEDLLLGERLMAAGGRMAAMVVPGVEFLDSSPKDMTTMERIVAKPSLPPRSRTATGVTPLGIESESDKFNSIPVTTGEGTGAESLPPRSCVRRVAKIIKRVFKKSKKHAESRPVNNEKYNNQPGTLMVVATLIATITFQAALNPPGGFKQKDDKAKSDDDYFYYLPCSEEGSPVLCRKLHFFLMFDMIGLFASLSIILLLICCVPRQKTLVMGLLKWILWSAVFSTALAFSTAVQQLFNDNFFAAILVVCWFSILTFFMTWVSFRVMRYLLRIGGCWKKKNNGGEDRRPPKKAAAVISKTVVAVLTIIFFVIFGYLNMIAVFGIERVDNVLVGTT